MRGPQFEHTRIMRDVYSPRFDLGFRLNDAEGRVVKEASRTLRDLNYLTRSLRVSEDRLRYEKALLRDWLRQEFAAVSAGAGGSHLFGWPVWASIAVHAFAIATASTVVAFAPARPQRPDLIPIEMVHVRPAAGAAEAEEPREADGTQAGEQGDGARPETAAAVGAAA